MKKILLIILGMFLIFQLVSALSQSLPFVCGGDSELLIGCLGDDELTFLSGEVPPEAWSGIGGGGVVIDVEEPIEPIEPKIEKVVLKDPTWIIIIISLFAFTFLFIFIYKKKKKKKQAKKLEESEKEKV